MCFCGEKDTLQWMFKKICFLFMVGSIYRLNLFRIWSRNCHLVGKHFADDEEVETEVRKWLKQLKDFYAVDLDAVVKLWDKCINADGGYVEK
jgi:hypothetical protein